MAKKRPDGSGSERGDRNGGEAGEAGEAALRRLAALDDDLGRAEADQNVADADQTAADADQTSSDTDAELADRDQEASDRDQEASDRDQAAFDLELERHPSEDGTSEHAAARVGRETGTRARVKTTAARTIGAKHRLRQAAVRDESARHRDLTAETRDAAAAQRDLESEKLERGLVSGGPPVRAALEHAAGVRAQAARDRARAAKDRRHAAADRQRAADERMRALDELEKAHLDELTGALRRGLGEQALQWEIDRARRGDGRVVLAFVDVDGLREVNNRYGHPAGDRLLRDVVDAIRLKVRSYEPIVRFGGDEFVCAISDVDLRQAELRFEAIKRALTTTQPGAAVSVGLAELRPDDTLKNLIERADAALLDARQDSPGAG